MTLRLGFVGVGRWARKLAESFRACGAEIVAFDRGVVPATPDFWPPGFGVYSPWREQIERKSIDAIVAVAPPEITTAVAMACAAEGKAVMATKPLLRHPETITNVFAVDFWRLWADVHTKWKDTFIGSFHGTIRYELSGAGPMRDFPGAFDYGPHVMAAVLDAAPRCRLSHRKRIESATGELFGCTFGGGPLTGPVIMCEFGNGGTEGVRNIWGHEETPTHIGTQPKDEIMRAFCQSFLNDVSEGFVSTKLLEYSREGMRLLRQIREVAK